MINGKTVLAVIPARGGSIGVPRKNVRPLGDKPLIAWTILAGALSRYIDRMILTSDDAEIISVAREWGCEAPFTRPAELASAEARSIDVLLHALNEIEEDYDYVILLQPTSPFRSAADIDACIETLCKTKAPVCVSVSEPHVSPYRMYTLDAEQAIKPVLPRPPRPDRRQDLPTVYALNGAVYVIDAVWFARNQRIIDPQTIAHVMPPERSIDIDTELDLKLAEAMLDEREQNAAKA